MDDYKYKKMDEYTYDKDKFHAAPNSYGKCSCNSSNNIKMNHEHSHTHDNTSSKMEKEMRDAMQVYNKLVAEQVEQSKSVKYPEYLIFKNYIVATKQIICINFEEETKSIIITDINGDIHSLCSKESLDSVKSTWNELQKIFEKGI